MINLSAKTLSYEFRESSHNVCRRCNKRACKHDVQMIKTFFDPESQEWTDVCLCCGMFEWAEA